MKTRNRRRSFEKDMADELAFHLEERAADLVRRGLTISEARRQARLEFGNPAAVSEQCRDARGTRALDELSQDLRFAWRTIRRRKLASAVVVLTLTLGVGISSGVFTMLSAATLRPQLPDPNGTFVRVHTSLTTEVAHPRPFAPTTLAQYEGLRERLTTIRPLTGWQNFGASVGANGGSERVLLVSCNFFDVYGVARAARGRLLDAHDCERRERAVVIAYDTWQRRFDADESIVGRSITIAGGGVTVVGVAAGDFAPEGGSAWLPFTVRDAFYVPKRSSTGVEHGWLSVAGRVVPGATLARAQAEDDVVASSIDVDPPAQRTKILVTDGALIHDPNVRGNVIGMLTLVMGALSAL